MSLARRTATLEKPDAARRRDRGGEGVRA